MRAAFTRRAFLAALPIAARAADVIPSQSKRLRDPITEFELTRLTTPEYSSWLIPPPTRSISGRNNSVLYCSDRSGSVQAFRLDLKSGESRQLTEAAKLDRDALALMADDRTIAYFDDDALVLSGVRTKTVYQTPSDWRRAPGFTVTEDGIYAMVVETNERKRRLRLIPLLHGNPTTVCEIEDDITFVRPRPRRAAILYGRPGGLWIVDHSGENNRKLKTAPGTPLQALWSTDGKSFTYLRAPEKTTELNDVREHTPDANEDKKLASTSQFITYARNSDASVFVGVSRNKAAPYLLLLLRVAHRELTVAEHKASDPKAVSVLFTPNSQRLLWHTDREGKSAIYSLAVEKFVEQTEVSAAYCNHVRDCDSPLGWSNA